MALFCPSSTGSGLRSGVASEWDDESLEVCFLNTCPHWHVRLPRLVLQNRSWAHLPAQGLLTLNGASISWALAPKKRKGGSWVTRLPFESDRQTLDWPLDIMDLQPSLPGFPGGSAGKESACNVGDLGLIPGLGRSPGEGKGCPFQYSGLENPMDYI